MNSRAQVEDTLRRIEEQVRALDKVKDPAARQTARQLFDSILSLHGLALVKIATRLAMSDEGRAIYDALGEDEQVKSVLLLHGLHPDTPEDRIRAAVPALEARLGVVIRVASVGDGIARVMLDPGAQDFDALCREVGGTLIDAAPDLDDIAIDRAALAVPRAQSRAAAG
jgi:hypothetical protein